MSVNNLIHVIVTVIQLTINVWCKMGLTFTVSEKNICIT